MNELSEQACIEAIKKGEPLHAIVENAFEIKIEEYIFFICTAIHDGHLLRDELAASCVLTEEERLYEEDPYTGEMIASLPISLTARDSRYEYDLNRPPEHCVYEEAWGKRVWQSSLNASQKQSSMAKHACYYRVLGALIEKLESLHGNCLIYDFHSYNFLRVGDTPTPTFNIGTEQLDRQRWDPVIKYWNKTLSKAVLPNIDTRSAIDEVFFGRGYQATFVKQQFKNTLVLPTEVKKVFMDENTGEVFPLVLNDLKAALKDIILNNAVFFSTLHKPTTPRIKAHFLSTQIEPAVLKLDRRLFQLAKGIETLEYINPRNLVSEKKRFFAKNYNYTPAFTYRQLKINPFEFREQLYRLPESNVTDITIQQLYRDVIDAFATKIDLLATLGTENFLYNSLRYYGEPSDDDLRLAQFLLYARHYTDPEERTIDAQQARDIFNDALKLYQIQCKVIVTDKIIASAMVDNSKKTILINKALKMNRMELEALIHHELGVHMVTTVNANIQKLKIFKLGLPGNTYSQEGLAILAEYMTGNIDLTRLKTLALRVIAVNQMINQYDFSHTFKTLTNDYGISRDLAFNLTARVYRGGGFTKDYLYLRGVKDALKLYARSPLDNLYIGKTSFTYLHVINEMIERGMADKPKYLPLYLQKKMPKKLDPILDYLINAAA